MSGCCITGEDTDEDMITAGEDDNGGLPGRAAKYFATISTIPDHWVPSSGILEALQGEEKERKGSLISRFCLRGD